MKKEFICTSVFDRYWKTFGLTDNDLQNLQNYIMRNPLIGDMIEGTGGAYKIRYALPNRGKSGSIRVIYVDLIQSEKIYLITCYPKSKQDNITDEGKQNIKTIVKGIIKNEGRL